MTWSRSPFQCEMTWSRSPLSMWDDMITLPVINVRWPDHVPRHQCEMTWSRSPLSMCDDLITFPVINVRWPDHVPRFRNGRCCRQHDGVNMAASLSRHSLNLNVYKKVIIKWCNSAINRDACSALVCVTFRVISQNLLTLLNWMKPRVSVELSLTYTTRAK